MQVYLKRYGVGAKGRTWSMESRSKKFVSSPVCLDWLYAVGTVLIPLGGGGRENGRSVKLTIQFHIDDRHK